MTTGLSLLVLLSGPLRGATGPDVQRHLVAKGQLFRQVGNGSPTLLPPTEAACLGLLALEARDAEAVRTARASHPGGFTVDLVRRQSGWAWQGTFTNKAALDVAMPLGTYAFAVDTLSAGPQILTNQLGVEAYPAGVPHILTFTNLQGADPSLPLTIQWQPWSGGTTNDFIRLTLEEAGGTVFSSGEPGDGEALDGTRTFITLPAGLLRTNHSYRVKLLLARVTSRDMASSGVLGWTLFFKETELGFTTGTPPSPPPEAGRLVFSSAAYEVPEDSGFAHVTLLRLGAATLPASITLTTRAGTANPSADYVETTNTLVFEAGVDTLEVALPILDDVSLESGETVLLQLSHPGGGADLGSLSNAVLTITDNEQASRGVIQFSTTLATVDENTGMARLTLTRSGGSQGEVSVLCETADGTARDPGDFTGGQQTLVFSNGVTSRTLTIPIVDDGVYEPTETLTVRLAGVTGSAALGNARVATVSIRDDDAPDTLSFSAAAYPVSEGDAEVLVTVRRSGTRSGIVSADFATEALTARSPDDYVGTNFTLVLASNELARTIAIPIQPDHLAEGPETFRATLRHSSGGVRLGPITNSLVTLLDDEVGLQFSSLNYTNREGSTLAWLTVERSGPLDATATVQLLTVAGGSATPGRHFLPTNHLVSLLPGSARQTVAVPLLNDQGVEGDKTVLLQLLNPSPNAQLGSRSNATLTLLEDDAGGRIQFAVSTVTTPESSPTALLILTRLLGLASNVTCRLTTRDLTAIDGQDYLGTNVVLAWQADETRKLLRLPLRPNTLAEGDKQFEVSLSEATGGAVLGSRTNLRVTLLDDDKGGAIGFARPELFVNENASNAPVIITRRGGEAGGVRVRLLARPGTASSPEDFAEQDLRVEFAPGQFSQTVWVPIHNDTQAEGAAETVQLILQDATGGATLSAATNAILHIVDDEPSLAFSTASGAGTEGTRGIITVRRYGPLSGNVSVDYRTLDGTATAGADYLAARGTLSFGPNDSTRTIIVPLTDDRTGEPDETFTVVLENPRGNAPLVSPGSMTFTILDKAYFAFSNPTASGTEGGRTSLAIQRQGGMERTVSVDYRTLNGTARAGWDYTAAMGTLAFGPGETTKVITLALSTDAVRETNETFTVMLRNAQGGAQVDTPGWATVSVFDQPGAIEIAFIPAGAFPMGDASGNPLTPLHTVELGAYYIGKHEVTKGQWDKVYTWALTNGYEFVFSAQGKSPVHPAQEIPWYDALKWCNALSEMEGRPPAYHTGSGRTNVYRTGWLDIRNDWVRWNGGYRLPTEAEWEKAARGGVPGERFCFGNTITHAQANYLSVPELPYDISPTRGFHPIYGKLEDPYTSPVGSFAPNRYGLHDVAGNVMEMCWDWFDPDYYHASPAVDPRGPETGTERVYRGGGWMSQAYGCTSSFRFGKDTGGPGYRDRTRGFRVVLAP